jgi:pimeloyl-ACP methyl ester carboxylesterase
MYCVPTSGWNGDLVVFAHGYVPFNQPLGFYNLTLPDGTSVPTLVQDLGFAFATTSYRTNGLAILPAEADVLQLITGFPSVTGQAPGHTYLVGVSEGGLVTTLLAEQAPQFISGALAACGPIGNFQDQTDYFGDFRVLFDYFFPNVLPPSPISIPRRVIDNWNSTYQPAVISAVSGNPSATAQLIATAKAAIDPANVATSEVETAAGVLWYNTFATDDAARKLDGNPYGNRGRIYLGSTNDLLLNLRVERFSESHAALANLAPYETSGNLTIPLVTLHTTGDPIIPYWQELLYQAKAHPSGRGKLTEIPIAAYGHCNFTTAEVVLTFVLLVAQVTIPGTSNVSSQTAVPLSLAAVRP